MVKIVSGIPVGRIGEPDEVARCVLFLIGDDDPRQQKRRDHQRTGTDEPAQQARDLEQIVFGWNRPAIPTERVNLLYLFDVERIHTMKLIRAAVQPHRDPL
jgi:hypothetical protein